MKIRQLISAPQGDELAAAQAFRHERESAMSPQIRAHLYQPKTGARCGCRPGIARDNCPACEGTGWRIDFAAIRNRRTE